MTVWAGWAGAAAATPTTNEHAKKNAEPNAAKQPTKTKKQYLCSGQVGRQRTDDWLRLFDVVLVGCAKPGFFSERRPLFAVDPSDGSLRNTDGGAPIIPIGADDLPSDGVRRAFVFVVVVLLCCCVVFVWRRCCAAATAKRRQENTKANHTHNKRMQQRRSPRPRARCTSPPTTRPPSSRAATTPTCTRS